MKVYQSTLTIGEQGNVALGDATNLHNKKQNKKSLKNSSSKKKQSTGNENAKQGKIRRDGIYVDKKNKFIDASAQTESTSSLMGKNSPTNEDMLHCDETSINNWKTLAEERRFALAETLRENELLTQENDLLKVENHMTVKEKDALKEENKKLKEENELQKEEIFMMEEMLEEAKHLATLVQDITDANDKSSDEEETGLTPLSAEHLYDDGITSLTSDNVCKEEEITSLISKHSIAEGNLNKVDSRDKEITVTS